MEKVAIRICSWSTNEHARTRTRACIVSPVSFQFSILAPLHRVHFAANKRQRAGRMAIAGTLAVILVLSVKYAVCTELKNILGCSATPGFRVFYEPDVHDLGDRLPPDGLERLAFAAKAGESHIVTLTRSSQLGIAQEDANVNMDCLPWLSRFPGGTIRWKFIQLDQLGHPLGILIDSSACQLFVHAPFVVYINAISGHCKLIVCCRRVSGPVHHAIPAVLNFHNTSLGMH